MKCTECLGTCHVECKSLMSTPCIPTCRTPTHFVGTIADYSPKTTPMIPSILIHCIEEIESRGMEESGIYRVIAPDKEVMALKVRFRLKIICLFCTYSICANYYIIGSGSTASRKNSQRRNG